MILKVRAIQKLQSGRQHLPIILSTPPPSFPFFPPPPIHPIGNQPHEFHFLLSFLCEIQHSTDILFALVLFTSFHLIYSGNHSILVQRFFLIHFYGYCNPLCGYAIIYSTVLLYVGIQGFSKALQLQTMLQRVTFCMCFFMLIPVYLQGRFQEAGLLDQKASRWIILSDIAKFPA